MQKRIELILETENLTVSQFSDRIGIQRSGMSHILVGRNKPSLDFVMKVLQSFPDLNTDWLLFGKGTMYDKNAQTDVQRTVHRGNIDLFDGSSDVSDNFSDVSDNSSDVSPKIFQDDLPIAEEAKITSSLLKEVKGVQSPNTLETNVHEDRAQSILQNVPETRTSDVRAQNIPVANLQNIPETGIHDVKEEISQPVPNKIIILFNDGRFREFLF
ncbi:MAG: helix-turn-helix domain-containing protein [Bacteroidales bacterium]|jgi:transcriptional regulator with XRE-family HTH domain|nr:helix-turn-helix domain-containing protein [Bacteroidales bacterium]